MYLLIFLKLYSVVFYSSALIGFSNSPAADREVVAGARNEFESWSYLFFLPLGKVKCILQNKKGYAAEQAFQNFSGLKQKCISHSHCISKSG